MIIHEPREPPGYLETNGYPSRDNSGNPLAVTDWTGAWSYGYDANNRLIAAVPPKPVPDQPAGGPYGYDWVGNRLNPPTGTNHMVYNAADQLTTWPGMHQYTYYPDGSLQYEKNADGSQVMKSYTYTPDGLLATAIFDGKTLTNTWDADKNRVGMSVGSTSHTFVYDTTAGIPAVVKEDGVYYVREPEGSLIARVDGSNLSYYHFDGLGSTRLLTDVSGSATDKYDYDVYGAPIAHVGSAGSVDQPYQYVGQLGYYTHWQEPGFGLLQLGVRFYEPRIAAFSQTDLISDNRAARYTYASGLPFVFIDPTGLTPVEVCTQKLANKLPGKIRDAIKDCLRKHDGDPEGARKCLQGINKSVGLDLACELFACSMHRENSSEGLQYRGFPCDDPRSKKYQGYCQACAAWNHQKCLCKNAKTIIGIQFGAIACQSGYKGDSMKCELVCPGGR